MPSSASEQLLRKQLKVSARNLHIQIFMIVHSILILEHILIDIGNSKKSSTGF